MQTLISNRLSPIDIYIFQQFKKFEAIFCTVVSGVFSVETYGEYKNFQLALAMPRMEGTLQTSYTQQDQTYSFFH